MRWPFTWNPSTMTRYTRLPSSSTDLLQAMSAHTTSIRSSISPSNPSHNPPFALRKRRGYIIPITLICSGIVSLTLIYAIMLAFLPGLPASPFFKAEKEVPIGWDEPQELIPFNHSMLPWHAFDTGDSLRFPGDLTHVVIPTQPLTKSITLLESIKDRLPYLLLSQYYSSGTVSRTYGIPPPSPIDFLYLFVNASSPFFLEAFEKKVGEEGIRSARGRAKRWRDNGELRGAIRSVISSLGQSLGKVHVVSADYGPFMSVLTQTTGEEPETENEGSKSSTNSTDDVQAWTFGQIPDWIDWPLKPSRISWQFHSSVFRLPRDTDDSLPPSIRQGDWSDEDNWRQEALPSFNSFGIETRVGWVEGLAENLSVSIHRNIYQSSSISAFSPMMTCSYWYIRLLPPSVRVIDDCRGI